MLYCFYHRILVRSNFAWVYHNDWRQNADDIENLGLSSEIDCPNVHLMTTAFI